jgi:hypothetical protein
MLHVATDAVMKIYRRGVLRAGRSTPPRIEIAVDRWAHAYRTKAEVTLCGLRVEKLHWEPFRHLEFGAVNAAVQCSRCSVAAASR